MRYFRFTVDECETDSLVQWPGISVTTSPGSIGYKFIDLYFYVVPEIITQPGTAISVNTVGIDTLRVFIFFRYYPS